MCNRVPCHILGLFDQWIMYYSLFGAGILASADFDDRTYVYREEIRSIISKSGETLIRSRIYTEYRGF